MNLQTKISVPSEQPKINYDSELFLLGSCFAENVGSKFEYFKYKTVINPFGILFHPKAIETFLWMATQQEEYTETDLFYHNDQWHCFDAHSKKSSGDQKQLLLDLNQSLVAAHKQIKSATHLVVTLGTSWVYRLQSLDMIVANCHKIPQKEFTKELLSVGEVDNRSKSHLITAVHNTIILDNNCSYFPSYEIMMDELRDYRFYADDMIHPSSLAVDYIWERFKKTWIAEEAIKTMQQVQEIQNGISHRPFNPEGKQHASFLEKLEVKKKQLQEKYTFINF